MRYNFLVNLFPIKKNQAYILKAYQIKFNLTIY